MKHLANRQIVLTLKVKDEVLSTDLLCALLGVCVEEDLQILPEQILAQNL